MYACWPSKCLPGSWHIAPPAIASAESEHNCYATQTAGTQRTVSTNDNQKAAEIVVEIYLFVYIYIYIYIYVFIYIYIYI